MKKRNIIIVGAIITVVIVASVVYYISTRPSEEKVLCVLSTGEFSAVYNPFWDWLVDQFYKDTGIKIITWDAPSWEHTEENLIAFYASGVPKYDLTYCLGAWLPGISDKLYCLDEWYESLPNEIKEDRPAGWAKYKGHIYGIESPYVQVIFYNKEIFEKEGITKLPETWEEFKEVCIKVTHDDQIAYIADWDPSFIVEDIRWWWAAAGVTTINENGYLQINSTQAVKTLEFLSDLMNQYHAVSESSFNIAAISEVASIFAQGKIAMCDGAAVSWSIVQNPEMSKVVGKVGMFPYPHPEGVKPLTYSTGDCWVIPKNAPHLENAKKFLEWFIQPHVQKKYILDTGWPSASIQCMSDSEVVEMNPVYGEISRLFSNLITYRIKQGSEVDKIIALELEGCLRGMKSPKQAMDDAVAAIRQKIGEPLE